MTAINITVDMIPIGTEIVIGYDTNKNKPIKWEKAGKRNEFICKSIVANRNVINISRYLTISINEPGETNLYFSDYELLSIESLRVPRMEEVVKIDGEDSRLEYFKKRTTKLEQNDLFTKYYIENDEDLHNWNIKYAIDCTTGRRHMVFAADNVGIRPLLKLYPNSKLIVADDGNLKLSDDTNGRIKSVIEENEEIDLYKFFNLL